MYNQPTVEVLLSKNRTAAETKPIITLYKAPTI